MDEYGAQHLARRTSAGFAALKIAGEWPQNDAETAASDAISNMLTAVFGPALNDHALDEAHRLLERAFRSYEGDAEDYQ